MQASAMDVDFIQEIRLRTWARENYVPSEERDETWHPIVLDEMRSKDEEEGVQAEWQESACV